MLSLYLTLIDSEEDKKKFVQFYEAYRGLMHYTANRILQDDFAAEDAVQEAFLRIAKNFHKVGDVFCPETKKFAVIICRNVSLTMAKKNAETVSTEGIEEKLDSVDLKDETFERLEYRLVVEAVLSLPERYRNVLYLHLVYGYELKEVANLLGISVDAARKRFQRGKCMIVEEVGGQVDAGRK